MYSRALLHVAQSKSMCDAMHRVENNQASINCVGDFGERRPRLFIPVLLRKLSVHTRSARRIAINLYGRLLGMGLQVDVCSLRDPLGGVRSLLNNVVVAGPCADNPSALPYLTLDHIPPVRNAEKRRIRFSRAEIQQRGRVLHGGARTFCQQLRRDFAAVSPRFRGNADWQASSWRRCGRSMKRSFDRKALELMRSEIPFVFRDSG